MGTDKKDGYSAGVYVLFCAQLLLGTLDIEDYGKRQ